jgi:hypothetical protein
MFAVCVTRDPDPGLNKGKAKPLYDLLVSFADVSSRDTEKGYPYREALAACLDCSKQTVDRAADYLEKEIGLVTVHRRKVDGKPDENDANLYEIHDAWLIHGVTPPKDTPPQLVARYGHSVPGLDVDAWIGEYAPDFDLAAWRAAYDEKLREQEAKREEQRRKERARRKKAKKGGDVTDDATPEGAGDEGGSVMGDATGGVMDDASGGVMGDALSKAGVPEPSSTDDEAPSGRSPGGVRSTSTSGSSEPEDGSGSAAAGKEGSSLNEEDGQAHLPEQRRTEDPSLSREQLALVRAVEAVLPPVLLERLPYQQFPKRNRPAVLEALESRTVEQLRERVARRWLAYGYEPALYEGSVTSPVGAALELIALPRYCPDPSCEDGTMIDTGVECRACLERRATRRAARAAGQTVKTGSSKGAGGGRMPECVICQAPFPGAVPASGECLRCEKEAAAAFKALSARLGRAEVVWEDLEAQTGEEPPQGPQDEPVADEETARLRAALARQFGTPEQVEAYCTEAPF